MMKRTLLAALAVTVVGAIAAGPADAQTYPEYRFDIGLNGGFSGYTAMLDDELLNQDEDVRFEAGWLVGLQATGWFTPRFGLRGNFAYTERPVNEGSFFTMGEENNLFEDINIWQASGDLMLRPLAEPYRLGGMESLPFIALGLGVSHVNPARFETPLNPGSEDEFSGFRFATSDGNEWAIVKETQLMGLIGLGTDLRMAPNFGLRLEVGDRIWDAPLRNWTEFQTDPEEDAGNVIHQLYAQIGVHFLAGLVAPPVIAPAPAPPPPAPAPEPEPEPVEERISVCVVDPAAEGGLQMVDAIYLPETQDTLVEVDGMRRDFSTTVPDVMVANEAEWFVRGEPLTITLTDGATIEYTTWQSARMIDADQLTFLGTTRGLPVYASTDDVRDLRMDWENAQRTAGTNELNAILAQDATLAAGLEEVEYLYVPLRSTGCVFQTVQMVEQVRKK